MKNNIIVLAFLTIIVMLASCVKDEVVPAPEPDPPPEPGEAMLIHYWHFNTMTGEAVTEVMADFSLGSLEARITYPGTGDGYMDARTHRASDPVSNYNLRMGQGPDQGAVLRARNPAITREVLLEIPSTGFYNLVLTYATTRTDNGGHQQRIEYSADGGSTWETLGEIIEVPFIEADIPYAHVTRDMSDIEEVNDNPNLRIRFLSVGEGNDNTSGNQRFDNITLDGKPLDDTEITFNLDLTSNIPDAGELIGAGDYAEDEEVTIEAIANEGFEFINWTFGDEEISSEAIYTFNMPAENIVYTANFMESAPGEPVLIHYWHFNDEIITENDEIPSDFSLFGEAIISYPGTGDGYVDFRSHRPADPVSNFNLRLGQEPDQGAVLRLRNPSASREALFILPTTGYKELVFMFAVTRTDNGNQEQEFQVSGDSGETWTTVGEPYYIPSLPDDEGYLQNTFDLSDFVELNDNPETQFRILFTGEGNDNDSGNNRFDNVSLDGVAID